MIRRKLSLQKKARIPLVVRKQRKFIIQQVEIRYEEGKLDILPKLKPFFLKIIVAKLMAAAPMESFPQTPEILNDFKRNKGRFKDFTEYFKLLFNLN